MRLPCDECVWSLIPMIKRELVLKLHNSQKLSKIDISRKLEITRGSVTQYIQGKRASNSTKLRKIKSVDDRIGAMAKDISEDKLSQEDVTNRFCKICRIAQKQLLS